MAVIKKGTYKWNDLLSPTDYIYANINFTVTLSLGNETRTETFIFIGAELYDDKVYLTYWYDEHMCTEPYCNGWVISVEGVQFITVTADAEVDDAFASWFAENTKSVGKKFTRLYSGETVASSGGKCFKRLATEPSVTPSVDGSVGLAFTSNRDGTCYVSGIGDCTDTNIIIPTRSPDGDSVTSIGSRAFRGCTYLKSVTIPNSVTSIDEYAFSGCYDLKSVIIPNSVMSIGYEAFRSCCDLTSITIPNSVTSIDSRAFHGCTYLKSIIIPNSVTSIGSGAFSFCASLTSIVVAEGNAKYHSTGNCIIETATKTLVVGCKNSVIPTDGSVTSIGFYAFHYCHGLESIAIPNSITSIGSYAFKECYNLQSVTIPNSVTSIGSSAFSYCNILTSIVVAEGNAKYHSTGNCIIETATKTLVVGCKNSVIPTDGSVTSIGSRAFENCEGLESIAIPNSITSIKAYAFYGCNSIRSIFIPDGVTNIGGYVFSFCTRLNSIYCEASEQPSGWDSSWNANCYATVVWGYSGS